MAADGSGGRVADEPGGPPSASPYKSQHSLRGTLSAARESVHEGLSKLSTGAKKARIATAHYATRVADDWRVVLCYIGLGIMTYTACFFVVGDQLLPFAPAFAVTILFATSHLLGWLGSLVGLPPLVGMLFAGVLLRNLPSDPVQGLPESWSAAIRVAGLSLIFARSGLELDYRAFKKVGVIAARLTCCPGISEAVVVGLAAWGMFKMPIFLALTLGFILAAVSPAVVVNGMFAMQKAGLGVAKGIPSLVVAAASFDDVVAITGYSLFIGLAVPSGGSLAWNIAHGPLNLVFGLAGGLAGGLLVSVTKVWFTRRHRSFAVFITGQLLMAFFVHFHFPGAGALASLVMGTAAMIEWEFGWPSFASLGPNTHYAHEAEADLAVVWQVLGQPLLFSVIGIALDFKTIAPDTIPLAIGIIAIGLAIRLPVAGAVLWGGNLNVKEKAFIALSWVPKATVQAALATAPLDIIYRTYLSDSAWLGQCSLEDSAYLGEAGFEEFCRYERWGQDIIATAIFSIILTAPPGLLIIAKLGPKWLTKAKSKAYDEEQETTAAGTVQETSFHRFAEHKSSDDPALRSRLMHLEAELFTIDDELKAVQAVASELMSESPEGEQHVHAQKLYNSVMALQRHVMKMEFRNTPANQETAGQFFRVTNMDEYLNEGAGTSSGSPQASDLSSEGVEDRSSGDTQV